MGSLNVRFDAINKHLDADSKMIHAMIDRTHELNDQVNSLRTVVKAVIPAVTLLIEKGVITDEELENAVQKAGQTNDNSNTECDEGSDIQPED